MHIELFPRSIIACVPVELLLIEQTCPKGLFSSNVSETEYVFPPANV